MRLPLRRLHVSGPGLAPGRALVDLLRDRERRRRLAEAGLAWVQQFGWARVVEAYEALYGRLVRQAAARPAPG